MPPPTGGVEVGPNWVFNWGDQQGDILSDVIKKSVRFIVTLSPHLWNNITLRSCMNNDNLSQDVFLMVLGHEN